MSDNRSILLGKIVVAQFDFAQKFPELVLEFLDCLEYRSTNPGFPETVLGSLALPIIVESIFCEEPTERTLERARQLTRRRSLIKLDEKKTGKVVNFLECSVATLTRLAFTRPTIQSKFFSNLNSRKQKLLPYVCALHVSYIEAREHVPY